MTIFPSACLWTYRTPLVEALLEIKQTAFHYVDVETEMLDVPGMSEVLKGLGLKVSCVALDHNLPGGCSLDGSDRDSVRKALDYLKRGLDRCRAVGAPAAYVASGRDRKHLKVYADGLMQLAADAESKGIRLCVEHVPGRALGKAREALAFVDDLRHPNLHLLLDTGHTLISRERPWEIISAAGKKLGYVKMHDNNGKSVKHWALLDGRMKLEDIEATLKTLQEIGYDATIGLELTDDRASIICGLSKNRNLLLRLQHSIEPKSLKEPEARRKQ